MKLEDARKTYYDASGKASDIARQLCFAGIAIIWLLRVGDKTGGIPFTNELLWPLGGFVLALAFDLAQYFYGAVAWSVFHRAKEKRHGVDYKDDIGGAPAPINYPSLFFFYSKLLITVFAYLWLLSTIGGSLISKH